jgi:Mn2+/Fe2+ NRAMP family transporter
MPRLRPSPLALLGPGLIVAATGVGAGDLATAGFAGSKIGLAVAWAIALGAFMKFVLNEGLARWQLATDSTLLEGVARHVGRWAIVVFLIYLLPFAFVVGGALISATGVATHALVGWPADPASAKLVWGAIGSLVAAAIAFRGGFALFERIMAISIAVMFVAVCATAIRLLPAWGELAAGFVPSDPGEGEPRDWTIGLIGGVGGTVTVLCYGYWMRQAGRRGSGELQRCRIDLAVAYLFTGLFGIAMLVIANGLEIDGKGAGLLLSLAAKIETALGPGGRLVFLIGAWAAIVSSLLGVWQSVPMLFADAMQCLRGTPPVAIEDLPTTRSARWFLLALATIPLLQASIGFAAAQKAYAIYGAYFLPLLAVVLLALNGRVGLVGALRNRPWTALALLALLAFFAFAGLAGLA